MASFSAKMEQVSGDGNSLSFSATFSGGDSSFAGYRVVAVSLDGIGLVASIYNYGGGSYNTFNQTITGLSPGTPYTWTAVLFYAAPKEGGGYLPEVNTGLGDSGHVTTYSGGGGTTTSGVVLINRSSTGIPNWVEAVPLINRSASGTASWVEASALINRSASGTASWVETIGTS